MKMQTSDYIKNDKIVGTVVRLLNIDGQKIGESAAKYTELGGSVYQYILLAFIRAMEMPIGDLETVVYVYKNQ